MSNKYADEEVVLLDENKTERAILVLDMINEFAHREGRQYEVSTSDIVPFIQGELQYFRERMRPVIFCNTLVAYEPREEGENFAAEVIQALSPRTGEICISKTRPNAFFRTDLADTLASLRVRNLTIVGAFSHSSVITTAACALEQGFSVVVPETCVCSNNLQDHTAALRLISRWLTANQ